MLSYQGFRQLGKKDLRWRCELMFLGLDFALSRLLSHASLTL